MIDLEPPKTFIRVLKIHKQRQKVIYAFSVSAAFLLVWFLGFTLLNAVIGLVSALVGAIVLRMCSWHLLRQKYYGNDYEAFVEDMIKLHQYNNSMYGASGSHKIPVTIVDFPKKPIGKLDEVDIYEWIDLLFGEEVIRYEYSGTVDMKRDFAIEDDTIVFEPGIIYKRQVS